MNIQQIKDLQKAYLQARADNPGFIALNFGVGEIQLHGLPAMLEIAPLEAWTKHSDETHILYSIEYDEMCWSCCFKHDEAPVAEPGDADGPVTFAAGECDYGGAGDGQDLETIF